MSDLTDAIKNNAEGPRQVTGDEGSVQQHALKDQIEADKYVTAKKVQSRRGFPIRRTKITPGGLQ